MGIARSITYIDWRDAIGRSGTTMLRSSAQSSVQPLMQPLVHSWIRSWTYASWALGLLCVAIVLTGGPQFARAANPAPDESTDNIWPGLVQDIFANRPMNDGADVIAIEMPYRAEDAAVVPVTLRTKLAPGDTRRVVAITLVIDQNPAPMAARFDLGKDASVSEISTRVRVNNYTDVHAVAELSDGKLYVSKTYVKASGGCAAPAAKNADEAKNRLGQMRFRQFAKSVEKSGEGPISGAREAQIMIGHPNNSGLQMDQVTQLYIPPFFVNELRVWQDDSPVLAMEGGISISEDPNVRFTYASNGAKRFRVEAKDTDGHIFQNEWKVEPSGM
jgi:sulfur-oxidizing protein SoxY